MCCLTSQPHDLTEPRTLLSVRLWIPVVAVTRECVFSPLSFQNQESLSFDDCCERLYLSFFKECFGDHEEMYFIQKTKIMFL